MSEERIFELYVVAAMRLFSSEIPGTRVTPYSIWKEVCGFFQMEDFAPEDFDEFFNRGTEYYRKVICHAAERLENFGSEIFTGTALVGNEQA